MMRTFLAVPSLAALLLLGCGGPDRRDTGAESGAVPGGTGQLDTTSMPADTSAMPADTGMSSDTARPDTGAAAGTRDTGAAAGGGSTDSAKANQTKSGVTNTESGKSTLGPGANQTRPDQGEPVTSKGDVIDTSAQPNPTSGDSSSSQ
jgi:hypothetical protein